jgi:hypothetical protein
MEARIFGVLKNLILHPSYSPPPDEYIQMTLASSQFSTGQTPLKTSSIYRSPSEAFYAYLLDSITNFFNSLSSNDDPRQYEAQIRTAAWRASVIDHLFGFCYSQRQSFTYFIDPVSLGILVSDGFLNYLNRIQGAFNSLIQKSISEFSTLFESHRRFECQLLRSLFFLHSKSSSLNFLQIITPLITVTFRQHINDDIFHLPRCVASYSEFIRDFDPELSHDLRKLFYSILIRPRISEISQHLSKHPIAILLDPATGNSEVFHLQTLAFYFCNETESALLACVFRLVREITAPFESQPFIRPLAAAMLTFLRLLDNLFALISDGDFENSVIRCASNELDRVKCNPKFGGRFSIALSFIVDAFLKRGNAFKSQLKQNHIIALFRLLNDRYLFGRAHCQNLFWRVTTRSTVGLRHEVEFLNAIAGFVGEENLEDSRRFLMEAVEQFHSDFSYISVHFSCAPKSVHEDRMEIVPTSYEIVREQVTALLKMRFPTKSYTWLDGLATAECKVKTNSGVSEVTVSLRGVMLLEALIPKERQEFGDIVLLSKISQNHTESLLRMFITGGLVIADQQDEMIGINHQFHNKKIVLAENWETPDAKVKNMSQTRIVAARACIVRIMKSERKMRKQQLVEKVMRETSRLFKLSIEDIRRCIQLAIAERFIEEVGDISLRYVE